MTRADCVEWTGRRHRQGYGLVGHDSLAHRLAWEQVNGPIPEGMAILHRCDNPPCVNPDHLMLGTQADNVHDMIAKGRANLRGNAKLREDEVREIRRLHESGFRSRKLLSQKFGVSVATLQAILERRSWAWLPPEGGDPMNQPLRRSASGQGLAQR